MSVTLIGQYVNMARSKVIGKRNVNATTVASADLSLCVLARYFAVSSLIIISCPPTLILSIVQFKDIDEDYR